MDNQVNAVSASTPLLVLAGAPLTKDMFVKETGLYIALIGKDASKYSGHSYRSGCATSAAMVGMSDWEIKLLGRWTSDAYQRYIQAPTVMLVAFAQRLSLHPNHSSFCNPYITNRVIMANRLIVGG